jgi:hypothetical protein
MRLLDFSRSLYRNKERFRSRGEPDHCSRNRRVETTRASPAHREKMNLQLEQAVDLLAPELRALWDELRRGKRLRDLPESLGVSYRTLKRRWRKLRARLVSCLSPMIDSCPLFDPGGE